MTAFKEIRIGAYVLRFLPSDNGWICGITPEMMDAIEQAEKQEPVAVWELFEDGWDSIADPEWMESLPIGTKLYTAPPQQEKQEPVAWAEERTMLACVVAQVISQPQREWIGLTDDEIDDIWNRYCDEMGEASINDAYDIARAIEAAHGIKEKNT